MSQVNEWNESLFGCCDDCGTCCYGFWCAPCLFGSNAEKIDDSSCCVFCCLYCILEGVYLCWIPHFMKRAKLREKYNLQEDRTCSDIPATLCCGPCAMCQEAREMKFRDSRPINHRSGNYNSTQPVVYQPNSECQLPQNTSGWHPASPNQHF